MTLLLKENTIEALCALHCLKKGFLIKLFCHLETAYSMQIS